MSYVTFTSTFGNLSCTSCDIQCVYWTVCFFYYYLITHESMMSSSLSIMTAPSFYFDSIKVPCNINWFSNLNWIYWTLTEWFCVLFDQSHLQSCLFILDWYICTINYLKGSSNFRIWVSPNLRLLSLFSTHLHNIDSVSLLLICGHIKLMAISYPCCCQYPGTQPSFHAISSFLY